MSRELQSDPVSLVDRNSTGITEEQHENLSAVSASDAAPVAAEHNPIDDPIVDERSSVSNENSSVWHEEEATSAVCTV